MLENSSVFPSVSRSLDDTLGSWTKLSRPNRLWFSKGKLPTSRALEWIGELSMVVGTFTQMEVSWTFRRLLKFSPFFFGSDQEEHLDQRGLLRCLWGGDDFSRWPTSGFFLKTLHFSEKTRIGMRLLDCLQKKAWEFMYMFRREYVFFFVLKASGSCWTLELFHPNYGIFE